MITQEYVEFMSPGTFVAETDLHKVDSRDVGKAIELARDIKQRYGARPYGFRFLTRGRQENELDAKEIDRGNMYYLGGIVRTIEQVRAANDPSERILLSNMERNGWARIVENTNSRKWRRPLCEGDVVLEFAP